MNSQAITRIQGIVVIVIIIVAAAAGYFFLTPTQRPYITVTTWGDPYQGALENSTAAQFEQQYGVDVKYELQGSSMEMASKLISEATGGYPSADVFYGGEPAMIRLAEAGMLVPLSESAIPNLADVPAGARQKFNLYVGTDGIPEGWALRTDLIPPNLAYNGSWRWFLNPQLKGRFAVHDPTWSFQMSWATAVYGGNDYNYDPAIKFFKDFAPNLKFVFSTEAEGANALATGEVWGIYIPAPTIYGLSKQNTVAQLVYPTDVPTVDNITSPITFDIDAMAIVKGGKVDLAQKFINLMLSPDNQYAYCSAIAGNPINTKTKPLPADLAPFTLTGAMLNRAWRPDEDYYATIQDQLVERWRTEITPLIGQSGTPALSLQLLRLLAEPAAFSPLAIGMISIQVVSVQCKKLN